MGREDQRQSIPPTQGMGIEKGRKAVPPECHVSHGLGRLLVPQMPLEGHRKAFKAVTYFPAA